MYCHKCGSKLVDGALFCSVCGTKVVLPDLGTAEGSKEAVPAVQEVPAPPAEVFEEPAVMDEETVAEDLLSVPEENMPCPEETETCQEIPEDDPNGEPEEPVKESYWDDNPGCETVPAEDESEELTEPEPQPEPAPEPQPEPAPLPMPLPGPVAAVNNGNEVKDPFTGIGNEPHMPDFGQVLSGKEAPTRLPEISAPAAVPKQTEELTLDIYATQLQVSNGEALIISDPRLPSRVQVRLTPQMKDGMKFRLNLPAGTAGPSSVIAVLHVSAPPASYFVPTPAPAPQLQIPQQAGQPETLNTSAVFQGGTVRGQMQICVESELNRNRMGRKYEDSNVDFFSDRMEVYRKNSFMSGALGVIGSAAEGKGKYFARIMRNQIVRHENIVDMNGRRIGYRMYLEDGRLFLFNPSGSASVKRASFDTVDSFLRQR